MPVSCDRNSLAEASDCYICLSPQVMSAVRILLLCNYVNGETMTCTPEALVESAVSAGYDRMSPAQQGAIELMLLCEIANSGGGGGGGGVGAVMRGSGPPTDPPSSVLQGAVYYDDDAASPSYDITWNWSVPLQAWIGA